jgi:hypothetical protein
MIRTVWLTIACLALLGALAVGKALTTPVAPTTSEGQVDETTVGTGLTQDTLTKADRLEITYVRQETPAQSALPPTEPFIPPVPKIVPPVETRTISRHWRDPNARTSSAAKSKRHKQAVATKKRKSVDPKDHQAADRSKPAEQAKACSRPGAFGDLLRSLNLSPACHS